MSYYKSLARYSTFPTVDTLVCSLDTETTGSYLHHKDRMFFLSMTFNKVITVRGQGTGNRFCWEWPVDPLTRQPLIPPEDLEIIEEILARRDITFCIHNALFDTSVLCKEIDFDPVDFLSRCHDTMLMSHAYNSQESHGAKDLGIKYLGISDGDQKDLKDAVMQARAIAGSLGWAIASKEQLPMYGRAPKVGWWVIDMWVPRAVAQHLEYEPDHPWWTVCSKYGNYDTLRGLGLYFGLRKALTAEKLWQPYLENRASLIPCFTMEYQGLHVHTAEAVNLSDKFSGVKALLEPAMAASIGRRFFRPNCTEDIKKVLYQEYAVAPTFLTKTGNPSTGKEVLTDIIKRLGPSAKSLKLKGPDSFRPPLQHVEVEDYNEYRKRLTRWANDLSESDQLLHFASCLMMWKKLRSSTRTIETYLTKLLDGTLFPRYNPTGTKTTRLSSSDPNGQNISKGKMPFIEFLFEFSLSLRRLFGPAAGNEWWSIDYKQLQLVIFAHLAQDEKMLEAIASGYDFHTFMAQLIFDTKEPTGGQRTIAKNVNFGFVFGAQPAKIERTAHMPGLWAKLCSLFPAATGFMETTSREVVRNGYVTTVGGYRLYVPEDKPYAGVNYKVQGAEGVIVKRAMLLCYDYLRDNKRPLNLISNIHDELVFSGRQGGGYNHIHNVCQLMEDAGASLGIPVQVSASYINKSWAEGHEVTWNGTKPLLKDENATRFMLNIGDDYVGNLGSR